MANVYIENFKSIKSISLKDCRRINIFIGRPNVGKSNIIEALALFDVPYMVNTNHKSLKNFIRIENLPDLFHSGISTNPIKVRVEDYSFNDKSTLVNKVTVNSSANNGLLIEIEAKGDISKYAFTSTLNLSTKKDPSILPNILTYFFPKHFVSESSNANFLLPPFGSNLMETVARLPQLKTNLAELFHGYGLKMIFDLGSKQIIGMRENGLDVYQVPFNLFSDSLQRLIFYKCAIKSNHEKVLCFEEPEAHTFPPYISNIVNTIIDSKDNQFFITTHSPYVVNSLLENVESDLAIFVVDMKNSETIVHRLSDIQLQEAYDNGMDMFFNLEAFLC